VGAVFLFRFFEFAHAKVKLLQTAGRKAPVERVTIKHMQKPVFEANRVSLAISESNNSLASNERYQALIDI
jgi:hypothetical protein